jgi:hypothetical protein
LSAIGVNSFSNSIVAADDIKNYALRYGLAAYNTKLTALQTFLRLQIFCGRGAALFDKPSALASLDSTLRHANGQHVLIGRCRLHQEQCLIPGETSMLFWSKIAAAGS